MSLVISSAIGGRTPARRCPTRHLEAPFSSLWIGQAFDDSRLGQGLVTLARNFCSLDLGVRLTDLGLASSLAGPAVPACTCAVKRVTRWIWARCTGMSPVSGNSAGAYRSGHGRFQRPPGSGMVVGGTAPIGLMSA